MAGYQIHYRLFGPELWNDPWLAQSSLKREVARAIIQLADGFGKSYSGDDLVARIKLMFFPIDEAVTMEGIALTIDTLSERGMVCFYEVDGKEYLHLPGWDKYQTISPTKRGKSMCPDCPEHGGAFLRLAEMTPEIVTLKRAPKKKPKSYEPSLESIKAYEAWHKKSPVPNENKRDAYCKVFDDMHAIDKVAWKEIYAILKEAVTVWVPNGYLESPMKLRKPSRQYEDMKTWQVIQSKMNKAGQAKVEDVAASKMKADPAMAAAIKARSNTLTGSEDA